MNTLIQTTMKNLFAFIIIATTVSFQTSIAETKGNQTVKEQLENLNKFWKEKNFDEPIFNEKIQFNGEVELIQLHLSLVEEKLRNKNLSNLSVEQKSNRMKCLNILNGYWTRGIFPKNTYHNQRTPYFIDNFETACAVGQLIISTGHEDFAKKVATESNYSYIFELNDKYSELKNWADTYGFTIKELAWIQPGYIICDTTCNLTASISASTGQSPFTYLWSNGQTASIATSLCPATTYTCIVSDALGDTIAPNNCMIWIQAQMTIGNSFTVPSAFPVYAFSSSTHDNGSCNGTATAIGLGGIPPYSYEWNPGGQTTQSATGLCHGIYTVTIMDMNSCTRTSSTTILLSTGIDYNKNNSVTMFPNPTNNKLVIKLGNFLTNNTSINIYNSLGEKMLTDKLTDFTVYLDIKFLDSGIYYILVDNGTSIVRRRIIKTAPNSG